MGPSSLFTMNEYASSLAKDYLVNKGAQFLAQSPIGKALAKSKLTGSYLETQREYQEYIVKPALEQQFGITPTTPRRMAYTYETAKRYRYMGTKYGRRRLAAKRALDMGTERKGPTKAQKTSTNKAIGLGEPVGTSNCKSNVVNATTNSRNSNALQSGYTSFLSIAQGTGINNRSRRVINLRGVACHLHFKLIAGVLPDATNDVIYLNYAVIAQKDGVSSVSITDFFRGYGSNRSIDFPGTNADIPILIHNPINTDKYEVLLHKKCKLSQFVNGFHSGPEYVAEHYIPIKRQVRYDSDLASSANGDLRFVMWYTSWTSDAFSNQLVAINDRVDLYTFFRDPDV